MCLRTTPWRLVAPASRPSSARLLTPRRYPSRSSTRTSASNASGAPAARAACGTTACPSSRSPPGGQCTDGAPRPPLARETLRRLLVRHRRPISRRQGGRGYPRAPSRGESTATHKLARQPVPYKRILARDCACARCLEKRISACWPRGNTFSHYAFRARDGKRLSTATTDDLVDAGSASAATGGLGARVAHPHAAGTQRVQNSTHSPP
jgi:hypothetical protein